MNPDHSAKAVARKISLRTLFSTADSWDYFLMFLGTLGGLTTGFSLPYVNIVFGQMLDALNKDPSRFSDEILTLTYQFIGLAGFNILSGFLQCACWSVTGERQTQRLREQYVRSVLGQDIEWFDTCSAAELATKVGSSFLKPSIEIYITVLPLSRLRI